MVSPLVWSNFFGQNVDLTSGLHCTDNPTFSPSPKGVGESRARSTNPKDPQSSVIENIVNGESKIAMWAEEKPKHSQIILCCPNKHCLRLREPLPRNFWQRLFGQQSIIWCCELESPKNFDLRVMGFTLHRFYFHNLRHGFCSAWQLWVGNSDSSSQVRLSALKTRVVCVGRCLPRSLDAAYFFDYQKAFESRAGSFPTQENSESICCLFLAQQLNFCPRIHSFEIGIG